MRNSQVDTVNIVRSYEQLKSIRTISAETGMSYSGIRQRLVLAGVVLRPPGAQRRTSV